MNKTICALFFIAITFCMVSCSSNDEYMNVIPMKSAIVVSIDLKEMAQKGDLLGKTGEAFQSKISDFIKAGLTGKAYKLAEEIINDPSKSGLSFDDKMYFFSSSGMNVTGFVAKVDDDGDIEELLESLKDNNICSDIREDNDVKWTKIGNALCAFKNDTFLLLMQKSGVPEELKDALLTLMSQKKEDSFNSSKECEKLLKSKGDISAVINSSALPDYIAMQLRIGMPADMKLEEIRYLLSASFDTGKIVVNAESIINSKNINNAFDDNQRAFAPIDKELLYYYPSNTVFWSAANVDGKILYEILCKNNSIKHTLCNPLLPLNIKQLFYSIKGNISVGFTDVDNIMAYARVYDNSFIGSVEFLRPLAAMSGGAVVLNKLSNDDYEFHMDDTNLWFGVKNNILYITNNGVNAQSATKKSFSSLADASWVSDINHNRLFAVMSIKKLVESNSTRPYSPISVIAPFLSFCDYIDLSAPNWKLGRLNIVMKDKRSNALQVLLREFQNL